MKRAAPTPVFLVANTLFVIALLGVGAVAAWPIYESPSFFVMVAASVLVALGISAVGLWRGLSAFTIVLLALGAYLVLGVPLAVPSALADPGSLPASWVQFATATVFGWKQLVTVAIPVGTYQALLVPAFLLVLFGAVAAFSLSWRSRRLHVIAVPAVAALALFGLAFGSSSESDETRVLWFDLSPREFTIGLITLLISLGFLLWRARYARHHALRAGSAAVIRQQRGNAAGSTRRVALAAVMLMVAVVAAAAVLPSVDGNDRQVLRTAIDPEITLAEYVSPLSQYRGYFGADSYDEELFAVSADTPEGTRLRLAVLGHYDGEVYRVIDPIAGEGSRDTAFARIPSSLHPDGPTHELEVTVGAYSGVWIPTAGALASVHFTGSNASGLTDGFFYNEAAQAGVQLRLLEAGDSYILTAVLPDESAQVGDLTQPSEAEGMIGEDLIPENLIEWVRLQRLGSDGAALEELVERLRSRGYLSHALLEPTGDSADWMADLTGYSFEPSLAGHSIDRIDAMFGALIEKQNDTTSTDDADLVAAVGDDEQFAVATALIAQHLGFPSRVVLGFDLGGGSSEVPSCDGSCRGQDLIAWVEVQGSEGEWAVIDVAPQFENPFSPLNNDQQDPENLTEVMPDTATEQPPPEANPSGGDQSEQDSKADGSDLAWLVNILKIVGVSLLALLVLLAPFLTILIAKSRRRRQRLHATAIENRIVGGWDEYIDAAIDNGKPAPTSQTRSELARLYGTPRGIILATMADRAVFHAEPPAAETSAQFWAIVEAERRSLTAGKSRWHRFRAAVSLRSFTRTVQVDSPRTRR